MDIESFFRSSGSDQMGIVITGASVAINVKIDHFFQIKKELCQGDLGLLIYSFVQHCC